MRALTVPAAALIITLTSATPSVSTMAPPPPVLSPRENHLTLRAPKAGRARPLVVVVAGRGGAETTDFLVPVGVLRDGGVADVRTVSTSPGPIPLMMALKVLADATTDQFDRIEPLGADIVIVPAQAAPKDPVLSAWVRAQAAKGATIVSICEGARVLAHAGLLDRRRATTHWYALKGLEKAYPATRWVRNRRYVQDGPIISTTGVSASIPVSLALLEAIGGESASQATARRLGVSDWSAAHRSSDFRLTMADAAEILFSVAAFWWHETVEAPIADGVDEVGLALATDAWTRTYRTKVVATNAALAAVRSRHGVTILAEGRPTPGRFVVASTSRRAVPQFEAALGEMRRRYGARTARLARLTMEYPPSPGDA